MSIAPITLGFNLRSEWLSATRKTTQLAISSGSSGDLEACVVAFVENVVSLGNAWDSFLDLLQGTGLSLESVNEAVEALRPPLKISRDLLAELQGRAINHREQLEKPRVTLERMEKGLASLGLVLQPMPVHLERIQRGLDEAARSEGVDSGEFLRRYLQGGSL